MRNRWKPTDSANKGEAGGMNGNEKANNIQEVKKKINRMGKKAE